MRTLMRLPGPPAEKTWVGKLIRALFGLVVAILGYAGFFALPASLTHYPLAGSAAPTQLRGAYHLHSTRSDGRAEPAEIARAAKRAGLQFVVLTDHNPEDAAKPEYVDGVLVIYGAELSTPVGHLVALGLPRALTAAEREKDPIQHARALGAATFLSHPIQQKRPWTDWEAAKLATGIELYSADSMFRDAQRSPFSRFLPAVGAYLTSPVHGLLTVVRRQPEAAQKLLELSAAGPKVALCAHDAHGLPPYDAEFETLSLYLPTSAGRALSADPAAGAKTVLEALSSGSAYCAFHGMGEGSGFALRGLGEGRVAKVGDRLEVVAPASMPADSRVEISGPAHVVDGGRAVVLDAPGTVQIELWLLAPGRFFGSEWKPWIVPSPIRVVPAAAHP